MEIDTETIVNLHMTEAEARLIGEALNSYACINKRIEEQLRALGQQILNELH